MFGNVITGSDNKKLVQWRLMDLLKALILVSEKAANIARVCRKDEHLFDLLVQKKEESANPRFVEDFKTLADVLIQEMVKHDIGNRFRELSDNIKGEESNVFQNKLGEEIRVEVEPSEEETANLLEKDLIIESIRTNLPQESFSVDLEELGIWIDPIDCTAEYIHGGPGTCNHNIHVDGLKCVTILIGVFNKTTGNPVMGVINRPFLDEEDYEFSQQCIWGVSLNGLNSNSGIDILERRKIICLSSSEENEVKEKLKKHGFHLIEASGAGYKVLTVILGLADAYLLTKGTTFKWDTCAPQAILKSLGGDIVNFGRTIESGESSLEYSLDGDNCNSNGIIAFKSRKTLNNIVDILRD
ncbi:hypothetical protein JTB14_035293 [Gonioctena quinquepunctata]|nr:hypothetical protein JTB14_035293 [Gonioctena quinquepunctata]